LSQGNDHYVEFVKEVIWLLPEEQYLAIIGKVFMAHEKRVLLKTDYGGHQIVDMMVGGQQPRVF
jgi:hydrogenase maturation factor